MKPLSTLQIGLIASPNRTSGSDRYYASLLEALAELGVAVHGVVLGDPSAVGFDPRNVESFAPEGSRAYRRWSGLRRTVAPRIEESDLVVSHFAPHAFPALDLIRTRPLVVHFHGPWALEGRFAGLPLHTLLLRALQERMVYGYAQRLIVLSQAFRDLLEREYRLRPERVRVIPGGVDLRRFKPAASREEARRELGWPLDRPIVATVRRLEKTKGVDNLIDAIGEVRRTIPDVLLVVAGSGSLAREFERRVEEGGLERWVRFAGYVPDDRLARLYRAADWFVVPSVAYEGFGLVVIEALACGTPVLVTPVGGMPEIVDQLSPGLVMRGHRAADLALGLGDALGGRLAPPPEDRCVAFASRFSWPTIAARVYDVYREAA